MSQNSSQVKLTGWAQNFLTIFFFGNQGSDDEKVRQKITMMASVSKHFPGPKNRIGKKYFWLPEFCAPLFFFFFFRDLLRQGNTKRKIYGPLKQTDYEKNSDWWWIYGGSIWQRWWYMDTDSERWRISGGGRWQGRWWWCGGGVTTYDQNSKL